MVKCSLEKPLDGKTNISQNALWNLKEIVDETYKETCNNSVNCNGTELSVKKFEITNEELIGYRQTYIRNGRQTFTAYGSLEYR